MDHGLVEICPGNFSAVRSYGLRPGAPEADTGERLSRPRFLSPGGGRTTTLPKGLRFEQAAGDRLHLQSLSDIAALREADPAAGRRLQRQERRAGCDRAE